MNSYTVAESASMLVEVLFYFVLLFPAFAILQIHSGSFLQRKCTKGHRRKCRNRSITGLNLNKLRFSRMTYLVPLLDIPVPPAYPRKSYLAGIHKSNSDCIFPLQHTQPVPFAADKNWDNALVLANLLCKENPRRSYI